MVSGLERRGDLFRKWRYTEYKAQVLQNEEKGELIQNYIREYPQNHNQTKKTYNL